MSERHSECVATADIRDGSPSLAILLVCRIDPVARFNAATAVVDPVYTICGLILNCDNRGNDCYLFRLSVILPKYIGGETHLANLCILDHPLCVRVCLCRIEKLPNHHRA